MANVRSALLAWPFQSTFTSREAVTQPPLLGSRRQRLGIVRQRVEIGDHVGALAVLLDASEAHRSTGNEPLRIGNELVEIVDRPGAALGLDGGREIETATALALVVVHDAIEIRADAVGAALLEGVAGLADFRRRLSLLDGGRLQQLLDRLARGFRFRLALGAFRCLGLDHIARLLGQLRRKQGVGGKARNKKHEAGGQHGTKDFIDFEGVHFGSGSGPEGRGGPRLAAAWESPGSMLSQRTPRRPEISVCPWSGNPYKRAGFRQPPPIRLAFSAPFQ